MLKKLLLSLSLFVISISVYAQTYITNVNVADVNNQKIIRNQTVVITGNLISDIQKSRKIKVPENATVINGTGKYLFPGLVDAHIHFLQSGGVYTRPDAINLQEFRSFEEEIAFSQSDMETKLRRYLQNGITSVVEVGTNYNILKKHNEFTDKAFAPNIFITGPLLTTYQPEVYNDLGEYNPFILTKNIEDAINGVREQLPYKPDFIKIWYIVGRDGLSIEESARKNLPIIKAAIDEAHKNNLKVAIHATQRITAQLAVENGADYLVHSIDDEILDDSFIQLLKEKETVVCPTLVVHRGYSHTFGSTIEKDSHQLHTADPHQLGTLLDLKHISDTTLVQNYRRFANSTTNVSNLKKTESTNQVNLKLLSDAGVTIVTGTDAGNIGTLHASSYLGELNAMSQSGMSNWKIIQASTINGAKLFNKENLLGSIDTGKQANLILLDANPVDNINNVTKINTVINKGIVFNPDELLKDSPEDIVQRQLNAYNFRNIDAILSQYADDVEVYMFPNELIYKGKDILKERYVTRFKNAQYLHCELKSRIVQGNTVIDKERVQADDLILDITAVYHIENGKIQKVYFIR